MNNTLLLVEDSRSFALLVKSYLEQQLSCQVELAESQAQLQRCLQHNRQYFAAVVDLHLPDAPEGEAVDLLLKTSIPVIVFTSQFNPSVREDLLNRNVADYVLKQGLHNLDYISKLVGRIWRNYQTQVLIVDDSKSSRLYLSRLLDNQKYQVFSVASATEALDMLQQHPKISLMITDAFMDGMDGFELCTQVRKFKSRQELAIIGISAHGGQALSARFIKSGADDFVTKPYLPEEIFCRLHQNAERIEQIQSLKQLNAQKNLLLGMAAHDIRSPLANIRSLVDLLLDAELDQQAIVQLIRQSCDQMLDLLHDLLDISAIENGSLTLKLEECNLQELIQEQLNHQQHLAQRKHIQLKFNAKPCKSMILDRQRIAQVIDNLVSNAIKYSPSGSQIVLTLEQRQDRARIDVLDQGPGLSSQDKERLFKPFERLSNQPTAGETSTGLGLSICKNIVEAHRGKIGLQDQPEQGCHFFVELPLVLSQEAFML